MNKAFFFDRDGIINKANVINNIPYSPFSINKIILTDGISDVLNCCRKAGYLTIVLTNQPNCARGIQTKEEIDKINLYIEEILPIDKIYTCYHDDYSNCNCRKPKIGLFLQAQKDYNIDFLLSYMVGDRKKDIDAGINAGCKTIFVDYNYDCEKPINSNFTINSIKDLLKFNL